MDRACSRRNCILLHMASTIKRQTCRPKLPQNPPTGLQQEGGWVGNARDASNPRRGLQQEERPTSKVHSVFPCHLCKQVTHTLQTHGTSQSQLCRSQILTHRPSCSSALPINDKKMSILQNICQRLLCLQRAVPHSKPTSGRYDVA
jgi:hypothetical protein